MPGIRLTREQSEAANTLLEHVRSRLKEMSGGDERLHFSLRRRIYVRLSYDERGNPMHRKKLKDRKWKEQDGRCTRCSDELPISGAELDRADPVLGYTAENTTLICHSCHRSQQEERRFT
jgi:hypothetical protein